MANTDDAKKIKRNVRLVILGVLTFSAISIGALVNKLSQPRILNKYELRDYGALLLEEARPLVDFELVDQSGGVFNRQRLMGKWTVFFFGFTHCGDICPTTMAELAKTYAELKPLEQQDFSLVFVTVDPDRDTLPVLKEYVARYHQDFVALSGETSALINFASQMNVAYQPPLPGEQVEPQHSGNLVLVNPDGELQGFFRPPFAHGSLRVVWRSLRATF